MDGVSPGALHPAPAQAASVASVVPTQQGPDGIRYDFNAGCRVVLPPGQWRVRLTDLDTGNTVFETALEGGRIGSRKHYFIRFRIDVWSEGELCFTHEYRAAGRDVLIEFPVDTLGDTIAWFPYAARFQQQHGCRLTCAMSPKLIPLFRDAYPEIAFVDYGQPRTTEFYATYKPIFYFNDVEHLHQPYDYHLVGLAGNAAHILGVDPSEARPRLVIPAGPRPIPERYVVIAAQSTAQAKYWNNPQGWPEIIGFLKDHGYRVVCIDASPLVGAGLVWNHIPFGAEDQTGLRPLTERAHWLRHADFFIGLSSGLSWLAWATGIPVVLISGFTLPSNEFATPYRVINLHACNSCFNDVRLTFDKTDRLWCPRLAGTPRQFECTRLITVQQVRQAIQRIPGFGA